MLGAVGETSEGGGVGEMTKTLIQAEARPAAGQVLIVLHGAGARGGRGSEVSSSWRREGRLCEGLGSELDLEGGRVVWGRLG